MIMLFHQVYHLCKEEITLVEGENNFTQNAKNTESLNVFLSSTVKNVKIPEFEEVIPFPSDI